MFNGRLKITVISATELQETNFMKRLQLTESAPPVQLDPYVAIDVDEVTTYLIKTCLILCLTPDFSLIVQQLHDSLFPLTHLNIESALFSL